MTAQAELLTTAKKIAKEHGVKGFRKLNLKRPIYNVGRQGSYINQHVAERLIGRLESAGFRIGMKSTSLELAEKGLLDVIIVEG